MSQTQTLKPPEFTDEEQEQLGRAFGTAALLEKFITAVAVRVLGIIAKLFDVENISEVATRLQRFDEMLEKLNKDVPSMVKAALRDPGVFEELCQRLDQREREARKATTDRRLEVIREALQAHFELERPDQVADSLIQLIFSRRVLGGRETTWPEKAKAAIGQIEQEMLQTIEALVPKRPKKLKDLGPFVRLFLIEGIAPDDIESVRNALSERDELAKYIEKDR